MVLLLLLPPLLPPAPAPPLAAPPPTAPPEDAATAELTDDATTVPTVTATFAPTTAPTIDDTALAAAFASSTETYWLLLTHADDPFINMYPSSQKHKAPSVVPVELVEANVGH